MKNLSILAKPGCLVGLFLIFGPPILHATHPCTSPLIFDLDDDGVRTTTLNYSVEFDINGDGAKEAIAWTFSGSDEGFLWLDLNRNRQVDSGAELFGDSTRLSDGSAAQNGFEALAQYDSRALGGDGDGLITRRDLIWPFLRLWIDRSHDGQSVRDEIHRLEEFGILAIGLEYTAIEEVDSGGNWHKYRGGFVYRRHLFGRPTSHTGLIDDVVFVVDASPN